MNIVQSLIHIVRNPEVRKKIIYTVFILVIYRFLANIPTPGINTQALANVFSQNQVFGLLNVFSGGTFTNFAIIAIGLAPNITASIIVQILTTFIPQLEQLQQEGERGRRIVTQITRVLTVPLALIQSISIYFLLKSQGIVTASNVLSLLTLFTTLTAGAVLLMWLGENLTESGVGQGISLLIACNILASFPHSLVQTIQAGSIDPLTYIAVIALFIVLFGGVVFINEAVRKVPLSYTRRIRGNVSQAGSASYLPIKVNTSGVMPPIFAIAMLILPLTIGKFLTTAKNLTVQHAANAVVAFINNQTYYAIIYFVLIVFFTYTYAFIVFNPEKVAGDLQQRGGFVPGIRPGDKTADYLSQVLLRITAIGAIFLAVVSVLPLMLQNITNITTISIGGTGLIIVVGVIIQIISQMKAYMVTQSYENFAR